MSDSPHPAPEPIEGEVLAFRKTLRGLQITACLFAAVAYFLVGGLMMVFAVLSEEVRLLFFLGPLAWLAGGLMLYNFWRLLWRWPSIVLGWDRMQVLTGRRVWLEVPYDNIAEIALVSRNIFPFQFVGIRLFRPEEFDAAWPRRAKARKLTRMRSGFDLAFLRFQLDEPAERCLETMLVHYHRFKTDNELGSLPS
jgi:hypothetical protein